MNQQHNTNKCFSCKAVFDNKYLLVEHFKSSPSCYKKKKTSDNTEINSIITTNFDTNSKNKHCKCLSCNIIFDNKNTLKEHFKIKPSCYKKKNSDNNETSTKINDVDTISINNPEINSFKKSNDNTCLYCNTIFENKYLLINHLKSSHNYYKKKNSETNSDSHNKNIKQIIKNNNIVSNKSLKKQSFNFDVSGEERTLMASIADDFDLCQEYMEKGITKTLFNYATEKNKINIASSVQNIISAQTISLCFLLDTTGSMISYINGVKEQIINIINEINNSGCRLKGIAFVGYKDWSDGENHFEIMDFTQDINVFKNFISKINVTGGGDFPEDVIGGIDKAINVLSWHEDSKTRIIFHLADAPPHGKPLYHEHSSDDYPKGHPLDKPLGKLFEEMNQKKISYCFGRINEFCDKMIEIFSLYRDSVIDVYNTNDVKIIADSVSKSVMASVSRSLSSAKEITDTNNSNDKNRNRSFVIDSIVPDFNKFGTLDGTIMNFELPNTIEEITSFGKLNELFKKCRLQIAENPFDKGNIRLAYYGCILYLNGTKDDSSLTPIQISSRYTKDEVVFKEFIKKSLIFDLDKQRYTAELEVQTIASKLAFMFNEHLKKTSVYPGIKIKFLMSKICRIEYNDGTFRYMFLEKKFRNTQNNYPSIIKYTNNINYIVNDSVISPEEQTNLKLLLAFSHFSYKITNSYLLVNDLQGITTVNKNNEKIILLTDPAISCARHMRFGMTNLGEKGINAFFERHSCNEYCNALGLHH